MRSVPFTPATCDQKREAHHWCLDLESKALSTGILAPRHLVSKQENQNSVLIHIKFVFWSTILSPGYAIFQGAELLSGQNSAARIICYMEKHVFVLFNDTWSK